MLFFHCHQNLTQTSTSSLLALLRSTKDEVVILLREKGIENLNKKNWLASINKMAQLKVLKPDLKSPLPIDSEDADFECIDYLEFVQLCSDAEKIIAWK